MQLKIKFELVVVILLNMKPASNAKCITSYGKIDLNCGKNKLFFSEFQKLGKCLRQRELFLENIFSIIFISLQRQKL